MTDEHAFRIAVVGMACHFPEADTVEEYWRNLCAGRESLRPLAAETRPARTPAGYVHVGATLSDVDRFDADFFGMSPREAQLTDPQHRLFLRCAWEAFEDAGFVPGENPSPVGVFAGAGVSTYLLNNLIGHGGLFETPSTQLPVLHGNASDYLASKVSYKLDLTGPSVAVQTACSTSLVAIHQAVQALLDFHCDLALAGGASVQVPHETGYVYEEGSILSPDGHCRAFDAAAAGTVFGSGAGAVVLKRLDDALADGNNIHAVIIGSAVNNDGGRKVGYTAPGITGQRNVIREALDVAGIAAESIGYVEAHGTGTRLGDPIEIAALTSAYREHTEARQFCAIGSVKTNVGHLNSAAGVAGFIKAVLAVRDGKIPASLHFTRPNPEIDFANSPFFVNTELREWPDERRRAAVSAFGIGGTNAHVILERPPARANSADATGPQALLVSARTAAEADRLAADLATHLRDTKQELSSIADTLAYGRRRFTHRRVAVGATVAAAAQALTEPIAGQAQPAPELVWLFPGQGITLGAGWNELATAVPAFGAGLRECAELLRAESDFDLARAIGDGGDPARDQVALFAVEYALAHMWREFGVAPKELLGHSLGELVCATVAGVFALPDALRLVVARGRLMAASQDGAMLTVSLGAADIEDRLPEGVWLAADNSATRCVVAGSPEAVQRLAGELAAENAATALLPVRHAFHTPYLRDAAARFAELVASVPRQAPRIPFWSNHTGAPITAEQATDPGYWAAQMTGPVRFRAAAEALGARQSATVGLEVGPGRTLISFLRTADRSATTVASGTGTGEAVVVAAGRLWVSGVDVDFAAVHGRPRAGFVSLPTYPFARQRHWIEPPDAPRPISAEPVPEPIVEAAEAFDDFPPEDELTESIRSGVAEVWRTALGVNDIDEHANFFEAGGDSLLAVQVATRLRAVFPLELPLGELFAKPTIAAMTERIGDHLMQRLEAMSDGEVELLLAEPAEERNDNG
ncbi:type I polyketide synthase [Nocardia arthritidis]|uniref:Acyltransferase domain-containing protein n=1 Tax=Nocardia arthritidis TaxID=228602 RepID=A0A6G9YI58_9NOCA|nr:type I polyketide synthase [Nocardia arthritidis]QIS12939.1 acyltransferase domain-containing protein [Nocardia arthritidis]